MLFFWVLLFLSFRGIVAEAEADDDLMSFVTVGEFPAYINDLADEKPATGSESVEV
jgi:hypothetical protein